MHGSSTRTITGASSVTIFSCERRAAGLVEHIQVNPFSDATSARTVEYPAVWTRRAAAGKSAVGLGSPR